MPTWKHSEFSAIRHPLILRLHFFCLIGCVCLTGTNDGQQQRYQKPCRRHEWRLFLGSVIPVQADGLFYCTLGNRCSSFAFNRFTGESTRQVNWIFDCPFADYSLAFGATACSSSGIALTITSSKTRREIEAFDWLKLPTQKLVSY